DVIERPYAALFSAAKQRIDDLKQQVLEKIRVLLVHARCDQQLPGAVATVLDRVEKVRLAGPLVAEHGDNFRMSVWVVAVEIDDREKQSPLGRVEVRDVVPGTDFVVRIAGKVVAEWVPRPAQRVKGAIRPRAGCGGRHVLRTSMFSGQRSAVSGEPTNSLA